MDKFLEKFESIVLPISQKIGENKILRAISGGFSANLPVIMCGAIFTLLASLNIRVYQNLITSIGLKPLFEIPAKYTTDMLALFAVYSIARSMAKELGMEDNVASTSGIISLVAFLILIPLGMSGKGAAADGTEVVVTIGAALDSGYLGSKGLFTAMILGIVVPYIHNFFVKNNITIKLPDSVPDMISKSFGAIIPAICIVFLAVLVRFGFSLTSYKTFTDAIYSILKAPLSSLTNNPFTFMLMLMICSIMWFFGIHGGQIVNPMRMALYTEATMANLAAYGAGEALPNIVINTAWFSIGNIGGSGCAIGLCICFALFAKSDKFKALAKVCVPAGLCGISEPMVFGLPMVLNPILFIPMIVAPAVTFGLGYLAMSAGIMPFMIGVDTPTGTPILLSGFLAFGGFKGVFFQAILIAISTAIYYPFFHMLDKQALAEETTKNN